MDEPLVPVRLPYLGSHLGAVTALEVPDVARAAVVQTLFVLHHPSALLRASLDQTPPSFS